MKTFIFIVLTSLNAFSQTYVGQYGANPYAAPKVEQPAYGGQNLGIYNSQGEYKGNLNSNPYDPNSVNNPYGQYGSQYSPKSINNPYVPENNPYNPNSANNPYGQGLKVYQEE